MDNEYRLKEVKLQLTPKLRADLQKIPLLPGEAGFASNVIIIPAEKKLTHDMHVQIRKVKKPYEPFADYPSFIREALLKIAEKEKVTTKKELAKINAKLQKLQRDVTELEKDKSTEVRFLKEAEKLIQEAALTKAEKKYLDDFKKHHNGLIECLNVDNLSFLTVDGKETALNLIELEQLYQEKFKKKVDE